ncbi:MAG: ATP-binding protein [Gemmatimonadaceae bacterium]|nr:ATP-binding protein [Gemmatimonadaceae bacterium]
MRIAICGAHATGKSTLISELMQQLPDYTTLEEPYHLLSDEGHMFGAFPTVDDFQLLCESANSMMRTTDARDVIFDRSAADYLAYLLILDAEADWRQEVSDTLDALATLDLVVLVGVEDPDFIDGVERPKLRRRVDRKLREILASDEWGLSVPVIRVRGTPAKRAQQVLRAMK